MRKNHIKSLVLGLMFPSVFCLNVNASVDGNANTSVSNEVQSQKQNPLIEAAKIGDLAEIKKLIEVDGVDVDVPNSKGVTPLWMASQNGHLEVVECLVDAGVNVNRADNRGITPLWIASQNGHLEVVECLVNAGASANIVNNWRWRLLHIVGQLRHREVANFLIFFTFNGAN